MHEPSRVFINHRSSDPVACFDWFLLLLGRFRLFRFSFAVLSFAFCFDAISSLKDAACSLINLLPGSLQSSVSQSSAVSPFSSCSQRSASLQYQFHYLAQRLCKISVLGLPKVVFFFVFFSSSCFSLLSVEHGFFLICSLY